jgi:hypothetical protein
MLTPKMKIVTAAALTATMVLAGCETKEQSAGLGALIGAGVGAGIGYAITGDAEGAAWGAGIGALAGGFTGYVIGAEYEKRAAEEKERKLAEERGRERREMLRKEKPEEAKQIEDAAKRPAGKDRKPLRQAVEVKEDTYVLYDPATGTTSGEAYTMKGEDAKKMKAAKADGKLAQIDGYEVVVQ